VLPRTEQGLQIVETEIPGLVVLEADVARDQRGFFFESYHERRFAELGIRDRFVQDNHSKSVRGTLRGLHYQLARPQAKLCRVITGQVLDVVLDIRRGSPTFGKWASRTLSSENMRTVYIPVGMAHGFLVQSETAEFFYKCSDYYDATGQKGIAWNDPDLAIPWGITDPILSAKDITLPRLAQVPLDELPVWRGV
jgi:dTDP-4-dehydrorhamnose 3,5-epimerase